MPIAGYCHECGEWVDIAGDWSCPNGHPAAMVNGWYDTESGAQVAPTPRAGAAPVADTSGTRTGFLTDLMSVFAQSRPYTASWGSDTDMTVASNPVDGMWGTGKTRAEYSGALRVSESDHVVYFWETLSEHSHAPAVGSRESESHATVGTRSSGAKKETAVGPGSASWEWGYGTTRRIVEDVAARHGFTLRVVLARHSAVW